MDLSGAFLDTNRLIRPLQRRLHAAWCELRGETALTVPAAGWELARTLDLSSPEALAESRNRLSLRLDAGGNDVRARVEKLLRIHLWWADVWLADDSPYEIRFLSPDDACSQALQRLANPNSHLRRTGQHLLNVWQMDPWPDQRIEAVLAGLPVRTRARELERWRRA